MVRLVGLALCVAFLADAALPEAAPPPPAPAPAPVQFEEEVHALGDGTVVLRVRNPSSQTAHPLESVAWRVGDVQTGDACLLQLPPAHTLVLGIPAPPLVPYRTYPVMVSVQFKDREPVDFRGEVSDNPCDHVRLSASGTIRTIPLDGDVVWRSGQAGVEETKGGIVLRWDEDRLLVSATVRDADHRPPAALTDVDATGDTFTFAVAPAFDDPAEGGGGPVWHEFRIALTRDGPRAIRTVAPDASAIGPVPEGSCDAWRAGNVTWYGARLPWAQLGPVAPGDGAFRFAAVVADEGEKGRQMIGWGRGIWPGKAPKWMRLCRLVDAVEERPPEAGLRATVTPLPPVPPQPAVDRLAADSRENYGAGQGEGNWFYGYFAGSGNGKGDNAAPAGPYTDDDFQEMTPRSNDPGADWQGPAEGLCLTRDGGHPATAAGRPVWAVRRWKSPAAGRVRVTGHVALPGEQGDGIDVHILMDGVVRSSRTVGGPDRAPTADYQTVLRVREGALVDFALSPGRAGNADGDAATFTARIEWLKP